MSVELRRLPDPEATGLGGPEVQIFDPDKDVDSLKAYDAIVLGAPTCFGNISPPMMEFLARTNTLWKQRALVGKVGGAFTSSASQHGGQEVTLRALHTSFLHHGMTVVGVPYLARGLGTMTELSGGTPYGASTVCGPDGARAPSVTEVEIARFQGLHTAATTAAMVRGRAALGQDMAAE